MKWTENELIICYGYYKENGYKVNGEWYFQNLKIFQKEQNRSWDNCLSTFRIKLLNIDSYFKGKLKSASGFGESILFKTMIEKYGEKGMLKKYNEFKKLAKGETVIKENTKPLKQKNFIDIDTVDIDINESIVESSKKAKVKYKTTTLKQYLNDVKNNNYSVPLFQRKFVWSKQQIIGFLNALNTGFPFGSITVWQEQNFGKSVLEERNKIVEEYKTTKENETGVYKWILDGQQRTTSIIANLVNLKNIRKTKDIIYSFADAEFKALDKYDMNYILASDLLDSSMKSMALKKKYGIKLDEATYIVENLREDFLSTPIGITLVKDAELNTAIDIFTEMNTTGKRLSLFDIVHAKWQSKEIKKDLEGIIKEWLKSSHYKPDYLVVAKAMYLVFNKNNVSSKEIMKYEVSQQDLENLEVTLNSMKMADDFLVNSMGFKPELIPSSNLLRILAYAYHENNNQPFEADVQKLLEKYIRNICLKNFYSSSTDQRVKHNIIDIDNILKNKIINKDREVDDVTFEDIFKLTYNDGSSRYLFILNKLFNKARSLKNNKQVPVFASATKNAKINIHHIVPKSLYFEGVQVEKMDYGNSLANLAPILETENQSIKNKYPQEYYIEYKSKNPDLDDSLKDMLIDNEYMEEISEKTQKRTLVNFWKERAEQIAELVNK